MGFFIRTWDTSAKHWITVAFAKFEHSVYVLNVQHFNCKQCFIFNCSLVGIWWAVHTQHSLSYLRIKQSILVNNENI